jgi:hypothetical protein
MEKDHFEILLEEMRSNFQLAFEGLDGVNGRLDRVEGRLDNVEGHLDGIDRLEAGLDFVKTELGVVKTDVREMKRNQGLLNSIANDHESRLQGVESKLKDHLENHS